MYLEQLNSRDVWNMTLKQPLLVAQSLQNRFKNIEGRFALKYSSRMETVVK
jgi:hypothetical protein